MGKRGIFDPDYRQHGWNRSRYAPKNRAAFNITQLAGLPSMLLMMAAMFGAPKIFLTIPGLIALAFGNLFLWAFLASLLRRREWKRIQREMDTETYPEKPLMPAESSRAPGRDIPAPIVQRRKTRRRILTELYIFAGLLLGGALYVYTPVRDTINMDMLVPVAIIAFMALIVFALSRRALNIQDDEIPTETAIPVAVPASPAKPDIYPADVKNAQTLAASPEKPRDFEHEVAWLFNTLTHYKAIVSGGAGDGGADIKIYDRVDKLVGVVQCKRYNPDKPIAPMFVRELHTVRQNFGVDYAWLATTAYFTDATRQEADRLGLRLMDGAMLAKMKKKAQVKARAAR